MEGSDENLLVILLQSVVILFLVFQGAEFVVALTHMRGPNDCRLAEQAAGIDLILGGHDHDYFAQKVSTVFTPNIFILYQI